MKHFALLAALLAMMTLNIGCGGGEADAPPAEQEVTDPAPPEEGGEASTPPAEGEEAEPAAE